jgi:hypothetical protein
LRKEGVESATAGALSGRRRGVSRCPRRGAARRLWEVESRVAAWARSVCRLAARRRGWAGRVSCPPREASLRRAPSVRGERGTFGEPAKEGRGGARARGDSRSVRIFVVGCKRTEFSV